MIRKRIRPIAAVMAAAVLLSACGGGSSESPTSGGGGNGTGTLVLGTNVTPVSAAASAVGWAVEAPFTQAVYDSLLRETPDAQIAPGLATSWTYNADKTVLTLKLRTDVKFSDGTAFDAAAAAQNVLRFRDGSSVNKSYLSKVTDAKAVDATTLEITLSAPDPALLNYLAQNAGAQESPKNFGATDEATHPVGSGPYILDTAKTVIGSKYVYTANPNYWDKPNQHFANLEINVYATAATAVNAIQGGQVDGVRLSSNDAIDQIKSAGYSIYASETNWTGLLLLDRAGSSVPALKDARVRQAINYAIDKDAMLKGAAKGLGTVTTQIFGKTNPAFDTALDTAYPYDPEKAKKLLADAGYADGFTLPMPLVQIGSTTVFDLASQYLGAVGIKVEYTPVPSTQIIGDLTAAKWPVSWLRLQTDPTAWQVAQFSLVKGATWNPFKVDDTTIDSLVAKIQTGSDADAAAAGKELNKYVVDQALFNPWYREQTSFAGSSKIKVVPQSDNTYPLLQNITQP
jgi:peptide/nickel transport system substrate-binding protein